MSKHLPQDDCDLISISYVFPGYGREEGIRVEGEYAYGTRFILNPYELRKMTENAEILRDYFSPEDCELIQKYEDSWEDISGNS